MAIRERCACLRSSNGLVAPVVLLVQAVDPRSDLDVAGPMGVTPGIERPVVRIELVGDRLASLRRSPGEGRDLTHLLNGERHPGAHLVVEVGVAAGRLGFQVDRDVKQRAAGRDDQLSGAALQALQGVERVLEMVDPDVPPVDDAGEEPLVVEPLLVGDELGVVASTVLVDVRAELRPVDASR